MSILNATTVKTNTIQNTGGTTAFSIDSNGRTSRSTFPFFYAYTAGGASTTATGAALLFTATTINSGNYSTSTGRFTCTIPGFYHFHFHGLQRNSGAIELNFYKNGASAAHDNRSFAYANSDNHGDMHADYFVDLVANDYVMVGIHDRQGNGDLYYGQNLACFWGYLLN